METIRISEEGRDAFFRLLTDYYREGEDADTPQEEIDGFIGLLFSMLLSGKAEGCFLMEDGREAGFALWALDTEDFDFSELPGCGTLLEIGVAKDFRKRGLGLMLVNHAEEKLREMGAARFYVSAYGPAREFWRRCGYEETGAEASNGLPLMIKEA
jgi:GNAT superfamily N-acetyltransferase